MFIIKGINSPSSVPGSPRMRTPTSPSHSFIINIIYRNHFSSSSSSFISSKYNLYYIFIKDLTSSAIAQRQPPSLLSPRLSPDNYQRSQFPSSPRLPNSIQSLPTTPPKTKPRPKETPPSTPAPSAPPVPSSKQAPPTSPSPSSKQAPPTSPSPSSKQVPPTSPSPSSKQVPAATPETKKIPTVESQFNVPQAPEWSQKRLIREELEKQQRFADRYVLNQYSF